MSAGPWPRPAVRPRSQARPRSKKQASLSCLLTLTGPTVWWGICRSKNVRRNVTRVVHRPSHSQTLLAEFTQESHKVAPKPLLIHLHTYRSQDSHRYRSQNSHRPVPRSQVRLIESLTENSQRNLRKYFPHTPELARQCNS